MALTQDQWFSRLKTWVPSWFLTEELHNVAILQALAKELADRAAETDDLADLTFIGDADAEWLDTHGFERSVDRSNGELDPPYRVRIRTQNLISKCPMPEIKSVVDQLLIRGECAIIEDYQGTSFFNREIFFNRGVLAIDQIKDAFTIVMDRQVHDPYSFHDRSYFFDRSDFIGQDESNSNVFDLIVTAVNENKAFGALYRIVERIN